MISLKEAKKKLKRIKKNVRGLTQQRQAMKALLFDIDLISSEFTGEFAQPAWIMDDHPFTVSIIKNHPLSLRINHYHVDKDVFERLAQGTIGVNDVLHTYDPQKLLHKKLTTYGGIETVYRLMYVNEWFYEPESESSIQVTV